MGRRLYLFVVLSAAVSSLLVTSPAPAAPAGAGGAQPNCSSADPNGEPYRPYANGKTPPSADNVPEQAGRADEAPARNPEHTGPPEALARNAQAYSHNPCIGANGKPVPLPHECSDNDWCKGYEWFGVGPSTSPTQGIRVKWRIPRVTFPGPSTTWAFQFVAESAWHDNQEYGIVARSDEPNRYRVYSYGVKDCASCPESFWTDYNINFNPGDTVYMRIMRCQSGTRICAAWSYDALTWHAIDDGIRKNVDDVNSYGEVVTNKCSDAGVHPVIDSTTRLRALEIAVRKNDVWYIPAQSAWLHWDPAVHYTATRVDSDTWNAYGGGQLISGNC